MKTNVVGNMLYIHPISREPNNRTISNHIRLLQNLMNYHLDVGVFAAVSFCFEKKEELVQLQYANYRYVYILSNGSRGRVCVFFINSFFSSSYKQINLHLASRYSIFYMSLMMR